MKRIIILLFLFVKKEAFAQNTLSMKEFLRIVQTYHPVAKAAALDVQIADAEITSARGAFDPVFQNDISRKEFGGLLYYDQQITEVKIPTWFGVTVSGGIETLSGARTEPTDTKGNTSYLGVSLPVAKGLLMDERRAALQTAKIYRNLTIQQQRIEVNNLLYDASKAYWNWWQQYQIQLLYRRATANAEQRFRLVKSAYALGDRPAVDTTEALAQWQSFQVQQNEVELNVKNAALSLSVYLWQSDGQAYTLPQNIVPQQDDVAFNLMDVNVLLDNLQSHPYLQQYRFKTEAQQVEKRLKFQYLLPSVYFKYNQLNKTQEVWKNATTPWFDNNYKYGVSIAVPLRLSEGRGEYRKAKLKIAQTLLDQDNAMMNQRAKLLQSFNEWKQLGEQMQLQQAAVVSYATLQRGEETRWQNGESSLFLINSRELKTLESEQKLLDLKAKQGKALAATMWAAGTLQKN